GAPAGVGARSVLRKPLERKVSGDHGGRVTPVPIPNTVVKPACADGTWGETPWESRSLPEYFSDSPAGDLARGHQRGYHFLSVPIFCPYPFFVVVRCRGDG